VSETQMCACGHTAHWHTFDGTGECEHDGECLCMWFLEIASASDADVERVAQALFAAADRCVGHERFTPDDWNVLAREAIAALTATEGADDA
jgi:hypothetical protein